MVTVAHATEPRPFYAAIFGLTIGISGELEAFRLAAVTDPLSGSDAPVNVRPPQTYLEAARREALKKKYNPELVGG